MPGLDRRGPLGMGPRTGRRRGLCTARSTGGTGLNRGGRGFGCGMGFGRGRSSGIGRGFRRCEWVPTYNDVPYSNVPTVNQNQEIDILKNQAQALKEELNDIEARIVSLEK